VSISHASRASLRCSAAKYVAIVVRTDVSASAVLPQPASAAAAAAMTSTRLIAP